jgi:iron complex outermembrane recepter protein
MERMHVRSFLVFAFGSVLMLRAWAQVPSSRPVGDSCALTLNGVVQDEHDATGLDLADVRLVEIGRSVLADEQGRFTIDGLCAGTYTLRVAHIGCDPVEVKVRVPREGMVRIRLEHHAEELKEVEVERSRPDETVGQSHKRMDKDAMEKEAGRTLGEMLARMAGVTTLNSGPTISKPMIHGLSGNRVVTLNQGIRQEDQQWGTEHAPNLDPLSSDRITVVKGAASVQYGSDALGGVVITEPVELPRDSGISGELRGIGVLNGRGGAGNGMLQGGLKRLRGAGWRIQGSVRSLGDSEAPGYVLSNTGLQEAGVSASVGYRDHRLNASAYYSFFRRELGILRAAHIGNLTDLQNAISSGEPWYTGEFSYAIDAPRQTAAHHLVKAEAGYAISERGRLVLTYGYQADDRQEYDIRRAGRDAKPALDLWLATHTADAVLKHWIGKRLHGKVGFNGLSQENSNVPGTGVRPLIPDYRKRSGGAFLLEHYPLSPRVELEAGVRMEATRLDVAKYDGNDSLIRPLHDFLNNAVSLGANWTMRDSLRLRFNVGTAYRPPHVSELYSEGLHHGSAAIEVGDAALRSERAIKGSIDLEAAALKGRLDVDVTLHAGQITDFIYLRPDGVRLTVRGAFPVFRYVATNAVIHGVDATLKCRINGPWSWRLRGAVVRGRDLVREEWLFQMPADRVENALMYGRSGTGPWREIEFAVTSLLVGEQERIPVGLDFSAPPRRYHLIGLSATLTRKLRKGELRYGLQVSNLLNTSYRDHLDRFRYYADARGTDVNLWVRYAFGK